MRRALVGSSTAAEAPAAAPRRPVLQKGGLDVSWCTNVGSGIACVAQAPSSLLTVATDDGVIVFVDNDVGITARSQPLAEEGPNAMAFAADASWLVACFDDGYARVLRSTTRITTSYPARGTPPLRSLGASADFALVVEHAVVAAPVEGKRARRVAATHCVALGDAYGISNVCAFVCSAGKLVHCVDVPSGELRHSHTFEAPVRAICADEVEGYYVAYGTTVAHVNYSDGGITARYTSSRPLRSLAPRTGGWLAASTFDGAIEVWDDEPFERSLQSFCRTDGEALAWSADGGFLAVTGARAAYFDFTSAFPQHPYRKPQYDGNEEVRYEPDVIPRVCGWAEPREKCVAWAPGGVILATVDAVGVVRLWNLRRRLKKGGRGSPDRPELMLPQFFCFPQLDGHPGGNTAKPASVGWLGADTVAVAYERGDVAAYRIAPPPVVAAPPPPPPPPWLCLNIIMRRVWTGRGGRRGKGGEEREGREEGKRPRRSRRTRLLQGDEGDAALRGHGQFARGVEEHCS